jgi:hypothetical protein
MDTEFTEIPLLFKSLYDTIYKDISDWYDRSSRQCSSWSSLCRLSLYLTSSLRLSIASPIRQPLLTSSSSLKYRSSTSDRLIPHGFWQHLRRRQQSSQFLNWNSRGRNFHQKYQQSWSINSWSGWKDRSVQILKASTGGALFNQVPDAGVDLDGHFDWNPTMQMLMFSIQLLVWRPSTTLGNLLSHKTPWSEPTDAILKCGTCGRSHLPTRTRSQSSPLNHVILCLTILPFLLPSNCLN